MEVLEVGKDIYEVPDMQLVGRFFCAAAEGQQMQVKRSYRKVVRLAFKLERRNRNMAIC
ncbi:hypothetical protein [Brevibacillus parabrevis]|uniref:hypothetical protein n=1 Tax=Brevibacillus parabrevis TaxID=54914 RepID=UPI000B25FF30|nr:hypothetical protein [Brevibacillus parabrevis]